MTAYILLCLMILGLSVGITGFFILMSNLNFEPVFKYINYKIQKFFEVKS